MGDREDGRRPDARLEYMRSRILSTFPKMAGPKFEKAWAVEDSQARLTEFLDGADLTKPFLYCPDTIKFDTAMPKKLPKGKSLVFIKINDGAPLTGERISSDVLAVELGGATP